MGIALNTVMELSISHRNIEFAFYFWFIAFGGGTFYWISFGIFASILPFAWCIYLVRSFSAKGKNSGRKDQSGQDSGSQDSGSALDGLLPEQHDFERWK